MADRSGIMMMSAMSEDLRQELEAMERGALVRAMPELATLEATGPDRQRWLNGMVTCEVGSLTPGQGAYGLLVTRTGKVQAELWMAVDGERVLAGVRSELAAGTRAAMDQYLIMEDAELAPATEWSWSIVYGPRAHALAPAVREAGAVAATTRLAELEATLIATRDAPAVAEALRAAGAIPASAAGWERIRIERLLPAFGVDFDATHYPQEASLEPLAVSFTKGCYLGQEAVFMLQKRGHVAKRLVRPLFDGPAPVAVGADVATAEGEKVGRVTSTVTGERTLALAMVRYKHTVTGTELRVGGARALVQCIPARETGCA